jgi:hypothetical protein
LTARATLPEHSRVPAIAPPLWVSPAYADRDAVWTLVTAHGPYPLLFASAGYGELGGPVAPWFRAHWALDGSAIDDAVAGLLHHEPFVEAARTLFDAEVVRPSTLLVNLMGPMEAGVPHVDTPSFRGVRRSEVPVWMLVTMGASGLFERWSVRIAGALTWFHDRDDGEFELWPDGTAGRSTVVRGPFGNDALVADNDVMPHRVGTIGDPRAFDASVTLPADATIDWRDARWAISGRDGVVVTLPVDEVRVSILWKAMVFDDARDARRFDDHEDDLDLATIVATFATDLAARGIDVDEPADPFTDPAWVRTLTHTYPPRL